MRLSRVRVRTLMIAVAGVGLYLALLRSPAWPLTVLATGPLIGAVGLRCRGGSGVVGGALGGFAEAWVWLLVVSIGSWLWPARYLA